MSESNKNIIVLDDNPEQRQQVAGALATGHSVEILASAQALLPHLNSSDVNLLLVSADLLESYCLSVVLDVVERWPGLPIVIVSGRSDQRERVASLYGKLSSAIVQLPLEMSRLQHVIGCAMKEKPFTTLTRR